MTRASAVACLCASLSCSLLAGCTPPAPTLDPDVMRTLEPFPAAGPDEVRYVFLLPVEADESLLKVELVGGQTREVDCNHHWLGAEFQPVDLQGWGYTYYRFATDGSMASTMMGCGSQPWESKFIYGFPLMIDYNSRLPVVVYAPAGYVVRYRVYRGGELQD